MTAPRLPVLPGRACPHCEHQPGSGPEALVQREDLAITWLHQDHRGEPITEEHHCVHCQPHDRAVQAVICAYGGDGPLLTGTLATPPDHGNTSALPDPVRHWLTQHGWQLDPEPICPRHQPHGSTIDTQMQG